MNMKLCLSWYFGNEFTRRLVLHFLWINFQNIKRIYLLTMPTLAPSDDNISAIAFPRPVPPPVMKAILPSKLPAGNIAVVLAGKKEARFSAAMHGVALNGLEHTCRKGSRALVIMPHTQQSSWGVYWFHSIHLSVRPASSVSSVASTVLVGSISYSYILSSIFRRCAACKASCKFWQFFKICNFDFVLFWLGIWCESLVWVIMDRREISQNVGVLVVLVSLAFTVASLN